MSKQKNYAAPDEVLYHVGICKNDLQGATIAILPGDPGRVEPMAKALGTDCTFVGAHREYTSWLTNINGVKVLVCSTGMGGPSVGIGVEELARMGVTHMIRFGTTGTIQEEINLGDCIINNAAVRLDGTSTHFAPLEFPAVASFEITSALVKAAQETKTDFHIGISVSSDTFWPGQERYDSFTGYVPRRFQGSLKEWQALGATNYEMETSTLYVIAQALGIHAGSVCGVIAKRTESESIAPKSAYDKAFADMIKIIQGAVVKLTKVGK
ncbi:MAG: uridine phosphorylase [Phascolarctobacterium sp.]|nr:uridine phosphorylase [Phascolarctobacterium sp.]